MYNCKSNSLIQKYCEHIKLKEQQKCIDILNHLSKCKGFDVGVPICHTETLILEASIIGVWMLLNI